MSKQTQTIQVFDDGSVVVTPAAQPAPTPVPSTIIRGSYADLIPDSSVATYSAPFGATWDRVWFGVSDWSVPPETNHPVFIKCRAIKATGCKVLLVVTAIERGTNPVSVPPLPTDATVVEAFFTAFNAAAGDCVDAYEILNEPNLQNYNAGYNALANTVRFVQAPAYRVLHAAGKYVVVGLPQEGATNLPYMISNGVLDCGDGVAFHPYGSTVSEQLNRVQNVYNQVKGKPLWITEFNFHPAASTDWASLLVPGALAIKPYVAAVFYFRLVKTTQAAGPAAPYNPDFSHNEPFYTAAVNAMNFF